MRKVKPQLDDVEVVFDPSPLTVAEKKSISLFILENKRKKSDKKSSMRVKGIKSKSMIKVVA